MSGIRSFDTSKGEIIYNIYDLLAEIKKRPILWDKRDHKTRSAVDKNWSSVCRAIVPYYDELDEKEQNSIADKIKTVWRTTISVFTKSYAQKDTYPEYRPYRFARHMEFFLNSRGINLKDVGTEEELEELDNYEKRVRDSYEKMIANSKSCKRIKIEENELIKNKKLKTDIDDKKRLEKPIEKTDDKNDSVISSKKSKNKINTKEHVINQPEKNGNDSVNTSKKSKNGNTSNREQLIDSHEEDTYESNTFYDTTAEEDEQNHSIKHINHEQQSSSFTSEALIVQPNTYYKSYVKEDAEQAFFDSIKPTLHKMNDVQKLEFKIQMLKILKKYQKC